MQSDITIRIAEPADAERIAAIHVGSWRDAYRSILDAEYLAGPIEGEKRALWRERLSGADSNLKVSLATKRGDVVGFICVRFGFDPLWGALIDNLHVDPICRGGGIGGALLRATARAVASADQAAGLHLYVFVANPRARRFYERHGAGPAGTIESQIVSARGAPVRRLHWPAAADVI